MIGNGDLERKLQGRTLQVYLYLLKKGEPGGIREIQRDLSLSSPSVADYQVDKLVGMGLAVKDSYGRVRVTRKVKVRALESYVSFGRFSVPRLAFYASVFSVVAVMYVLLNRSSWSAYGIAVPLAAAGVLWLEAWKMWRFSLLERADRVKNDNNNRIGKSAKSVFPLIAPGAAALAVLALGNAFLLQYVQEPPSVPIVQDYAFVEGSGNGGITGGQQQQQQQQVMTIEESVALSKEKVAMAGGVGTFGASGPVVSSALPLAGTMVVGFLGYIIVRYRCCKAGVWVQEQALKNASGTQDYPERLE
ncbi:MAG TPA: hypothetical protein VHA09_06970 [Nitrososphaera sp.]|nr:hypothetical protein [Nitrososphaera sp.]